MPALEEQNKKRVESFFAALSRGDVDAIVSAYAEDGQVWTAGNTLISGSSPKEEIRAAAGGIFEAFPEGLRFTIKACTAEGERVAVEAESDGQHISGQRYHNLYHFLFIFREGKILQLKEYMDTEMVTRVLLGGQQPPPP